MTTTDSASFGWLLLFKAKYSLCVCWVSLLKEDKPLPITLHRLETMWQSGQAGSGVLSYIWLIPLQSGYYYSFETSKDKNVGFITTSQREHGHEITRGNRWSSFNVTIESREMQIFSFCQSISFMMCRSSFSFSENWPNVLFQSKRGRLWFQWSCWCSFEGCYCHSVAALEQLLPLLKQNVNLWWHRIMGSCTSSQGHGRERIGSEARASPSRHLRWSASRCLHPDRDCKK